MSGSAAVKRRHVFYLHGFDPRGPAAYHRLFQEEAARQAAVDGIALAVGPRRNEGALASLWEVTADYPEGRVETGYEILRWDDMVRQHWPRRQGRLLLMGLRYLVAFVKAGFLASLARRARPSFLAIFFPPATVLAFALLAVLLGLAVGLLAGLAGLSLWPALALGVVVAGAASLLWPKVEAWLNPCWLARVFGFLADWEAGRVDGLEQRHRSFADRLAAKLQEGGLDEVLIVGHSIGAQHAISMLAILARERPELLARAPVALLTLGQCIPLLAALRGAERFRRDLQLVGLELTGLPWVDVTAPSDPASSCAVDPLMPTGRARPTDQPQRPVQVSPRFHKLMSEESFRVIRRDPFRFHFQYLMASEIAGPYNFFRLVAGPERLAPPGEPIQWTWSSNSPKMWTTRRAAP